MPEPVLTEQLTYTHGHQQQFRERCRDHAMIWETPGSSRVAMDLFATRATGLMRRAQWAGAVGKPKGWIHCELRCRCSQDTTASSLHP